MAINGLIIKNRDDGRSEDLRILEQEMRTTNDPRQRELARQGIERIKRERHMGQKFADMRMAAIKAHRENNYDNVKDIHEYIQGKGYYSNE